MWEYRVPLLVARWIERAPRLLNEQLSQYEIFAGMTSMKVLVMLNVRVGARSGELMALHWPDDDDTLLSSISGFYIRPTSSITISPLYFPYHR